MKAKILWILPLAPAFALAWKIHANFHPADADFFSDPVSHSNTVDCVRGGFLDLSYTLQARDLSKNLWSPIYIGDLYWENQYYVTRLAWSKDGTLLAASIFQIKEQKTIWGCAYDFKGHQVISPGNFVDGSLNLQIERLLAERGGIGESITADRLSLNKG